MAETTLTPLPMKEAGQFWRDKVKLSPGEFSKLSSEAQVRAFAVTGIARGSELDTVFTAMTRAIEKGASFADFQREAAAVFEKRGWTGKRAWRLDNLFRTNIQTAYNVGRFKQIEAVKKTRPYLQYDAVNDSRTRPTHAALDGKVFPADHPFWDKWYPPNGFRCRCGVTTLSEDDVRTEGLKVETKDPSGRLIEPVDPVTGMKLPARALMPDNGFANHSGKTVWGQMGEALSDSLDRWHPAVGTAVLSDTVKGPAFKAWYIKPDGIFPVGLIDDEAATLLGAQNKTVSLSAETALKQQAAHPELSASEYVMIQEAISRGKRVQDSPRSLIYLLEDKKGYASIVKATKTGKAVFLTSFRRLSGNQVRRDAEIRRLLKKGK